MQLAMAQHAARLQAAVIENGEDVFKMCGAGLDAVFASSLDALAAAVPGQRALQSAV